MAASDLIDVVNWRLNFGKPFDEAILNCIIIREHTLYGDANAFADLVGVRPFGGVG